jgi:hypothetical protein
MQEWWPVESFQGHGQENAGSSSGWTLAAATRAVEATKTLGAFLCDFNFTFMHSSKPVFAIINQEVEQDIRHVDVVFHYICMLMMIVSN